MIKYIKLYNYALFLIANGQSNSNDIPLVNEGLQFLWKELTDIDQQTIRSMYK